MWAKHLGRLSLLCGALAVGCLAQAAWCGATDENSPQEVSLSFEASPDISAVLTRRKLFENGTRWEFKGDTGSIIVAGREILVGVRRVKRGRYTLAMDANGNERLDDGEWVPQNKWTREKTTFTFRRKDGAGGHVSFGVVLTKLRVYRDNRGIRKVTGQYYVGACRRGRFNRITLRIFDDNMDGAFTQDGKDAILIGRSRAAMPLNRVHQIGKDFYRLEVDEGGAKLTLTKLESPALGLVEVPINLSLATCLVFTSSDGYTVDLRTSARTGIPAGTYRLDFGLAGQEGKQTLMYRTERSLKYAIEAGKINRLRLGPPLRVEFTAEYDTQSRAMTVSPKMRVVGSGREGYSLGRSGGHAEKPKVQIFNGATPVLTGKLDAG